MLATSKVVSCRCYKVKPATNLFVNEMKDGGVFKRRDKIARVRSRGYVIEHSCSHVEG